jgi:hypothetical protein
MKDGTRMQQMGTNQFHYHFEVAFHFSLLLKTKCNQVSQHQKPFDKR